MPVTNAELVHNRVLLEQEVLSLQAQTSFFPDDICAKILLPSISAYITNILNIDLINNTDVFLNALTAPHDFHQLSENLYLRQFTSVPYLGNPPATVSYQKYIQLMKSQTFSWLNTLHNSSFDYFYYSNIFSGIMENSTVDGTQTLTSRLLSSQQAYISSLSNSMIELRAISLVMVGVLGLLVVALRVRDNREVIRFLGMVECIPPEQLADRIR
jgi:hypothetical protein